MCSAGWKDAVKCVKEMCKLHQETWLTVWDEIKNYYCKEDHLFTSMLLFHVKIYRWRTQVLKHTTSLRTNAIHCLSVTMRKYGIKLAQIQRNTNTTAQQSAKNHNLNHIRISSDNELKWSLNWKILFGSQKLMLLAW